MRGRRFRQRGHSLVVRQKHAPREVGQKIAALQPVHHRAFDFAQVQLQSGFLQAVVDGLQAFEGVVIAKRNRGLNSAFTVRKISHGEGVERVFQSYSPAIADITVKRRGDVRRAKLYYLRGLEGKAARIKEKLA